MVRIENPALKQFVAELPDELLLGQVVIRRAGAGYELRHFSDRNNAPEALRAVKPGEARALAQYTANGAFRPLKSAPTLAAGWRLAAPADEDLEFALNQFYPGAIADWYAARAPAPPVTHYREYVGRQSGMYRITAMLTDSQAAVVIRAGCDPALCLKRRLWKVPGLPADAASEKSLIPCLEPCAIFLELARKAMRLEQEEKLRPVLESAVAA